MLIKTEQNRRTAGATWLNWPPIRRKRVAPYGRYLTWGTGTKGPLEARFAAVRVRIPKSRSERWLLCQESLVDDERQYYFSNLPPATTLTTLVRIARSRWAIE